MEPGWADQLEHRCCWQAWILVELASLNSIVNRLEHGWTGQLEQYCWQAWTWSSWPVWTWLLTGLFMHVGTDCWWLDERTDLNNVVGTIMINQQPCSCMRTCCHAGNDKITRLNSEVTTTMNTDLVVVSSRVSHLLTPIRKQTLSTRQTQGIQYVETWLNNTVILSILILSINVNSVGEGTSACAVPRHDPGKCWDLEYLKWHFLHFWR